MKSEKIKRLLVWLRRMRYSRGFGVQSPWAYSFIRYVINEHYPYYAYETLDRQYAHESAKARKLARLYFRLANHVQSDVAIDFNAPSPIYADYIRAGCRKCEVISNNSSLHTPHSSLKLIRISMTGSYAEFYREIDPRLQPHTFIVFEGIKKNRETKRFWRNMVDNTPGIVTFDLYYCGIVYKDSSRHKQNYVVNF